MFTLSRITGSYTIPLTVFYVDSLDDVYTQADIQIQATRADDVLSFGLTNAQVSFDGVNFPLVGSSFLAAQTGTLSIRVFEALTSGLYAYFFSTAGPVVPPGMGSAIAGMTPCAMPLTALTRLPTVVQVQSFEFPAAYAVSSPFIARVGYP